MNETNNTLQQIAAMQHFSGVPQDELAQLTAFPVEHFAAGDVLLRAGEVSFRLLIVLTGSFQVKRQDSKDANANLTRANGHGPTLVGEVGLIAEMPTPYTLSATSEITAIVVDREEFWPLMARLPKFRSAILHSSFTRFNMRQDMDIREQKLAALGTLTAGLMHELNNPGAAAGRAAKQLRDNLNTMHDLAKSFSEEEDHHTPEQTRCFWEMQERVLGRKKVDYMNSIDQSDAEEKLVEWMEDNNVRNPWKIAPTFAASGITGEELQCLKQDLDDISDELYWMATMVGGMQLVDTIEESVGRISALAGAVKTYTHEGQGNTHTIQINESVFSTIVILKHKMRERGTKLSKIFGEGIPSIAAQKSSLNQVWTNLIDNAIDAAGEGGEVEVKTWQEGGDIFVAVNDNGPGIPEDKQPHIFDPFFTTKPAGEGTGLGLGIAFQIVLEYGGELHFTSEPGRTSFVVHLPVRNA